MSEPRFLKPSEVTEEGWYWGKYDATSATNLYYLALTRDLSLRVRDASP